MQYQRSVSSIRFHFPCVLIADSSLYTTQTTQGMKMSLSVGIKKILGTFRLNHKTEIGMTDKLALPTLIALCSVALLRPAVSGLAVLGEISISGTLIKVDELANALQVCLDSGAKKVLPITSAADLGAVPADLIGSFNLIFYNSAEDAVFKALGVE